MKKILKSFVFWGMIIGLAIIILHQLGYDSKSMVLISLNPILSIFASSDGFLDFMNSGYQVHCRNLIGGNTISIYWYIGSFLTFILYGGVIDIVRLAVKKSRKEKAVK